ncbi:hypothetical protein KTQ42_06895|nr:hypothetical protein [Noviherbaspirillum sp. L7-7A]MBV0879033.1 hypothetical protein [Noviherbaspirillum sp. L7-7A]
MKFIEHGFLFQKPDPDISPSIPPANQPPGTAADDEELPVPPVFPTA